ncbi:copper homeostasis protein CutC [bacterium]|nr:copper homeostasis protein CutC [bacterium]
MFTLEICIDSVESAIIAQRAGANRVELCADLLEGGITPSYGMIKTVRDNINLDLSVMIRPRGGDFCYSDLEFSIMKEDILIAKELGANYVVLGILTPDGHVDVYRTSQLIELAKPMQVTFHRAFDFTLDPFQALEDVIKTGARRLLTSGQEPKAIQGKELIKDLVALSKERISIMAGSGVNPDNKAELLDYCGVKELHLSAKTTKNSLMNFQTERLSLTSNLPANSYQNNIADYEMIKKMLSP